MNVSLKWLKEYVDLDENVDIKEIVEKITISGSKVEKFEKYGNEVTNVYTALVQNIVKHPEDKDLNIVYLSLGDKELIAVAKIPDIEIGDIVPVALPGANITGKTVKEGLVKGVKSQCMICHILDFSLTKEQFPIVKPSGLISFPKDVKLGLDVSKLIGLGDYIIEFEITPDRVDCLSVEGIARELAATFGLPCKKLWQDKKLDVNYVDNVDNIDVVIKTDDCRKYILNVINNVEIKESPFEIQIKLMKSGFTIINNIVDITNYVMLEIGQPLHAFDKNALNKGIIVRQAHKGEKLITLDGEERILNSSNMVIADKDKALAIAGVMGGLDSAITDKTTSVVIESANFVRGSIRSTSKMLQLRTDASSNFEKGMPPMLTLSAMNRVYDLINKTGAGKVELNYVNVDNYMDEEFKLKIDYEKINKINGINIPNKDIDNILTSLNITVEDGVANIPYYREDLRITEDLSEEVARLYGYDKLPSTLPSTAATFGGRTKKQIFEDKLKELSTSYGFNEIYTYTFFSMDTIKKAIPDGNKELFNFVKLSNPLSIDFEYMRTTTVPHMLEALEKNYLQKNTNTRLFELGKVFLNADNIKNNELCNESQHLTLGIYGEDVDFYSAKLAVTNILNNFKIDTEAIRSNESYLHPGISADLILEGDIIATLGKVHPKTIRNYTLPENTYIAVIYTEKLFEKLTHEIKFKELPKYPAVERDIAFVIDENVLSGEIIKEIKNINKDIVEDVILFDVYQGNQISSGKKSMAYNIKLRSSEKTLEDKEISTFMESLFKMLDKKFNAEIRK